MDSKNSPTKTYLKEYTQAKDQQAVLYSTPLAEYNEILDYLQTVKVGPQNIKIKLDEASREVDFIKFKGQKFQNRALNGGRHNAQTTKNNRTQMF